MQDDEDTVFFEVHEIVVQKLGHVPIAKGDFHLLPKKVQKFIAKWVQICQPRCLYICDGSHSEAEEITHKLEERGLLHKLVKYENNYICRTDPADVARVESKTWMCTADKYQSVPHVAPGVQGILGKWCSPEDAASQLEYFNGCMAGRTMYAIPFSMGPIGSPLSKIGIEITDSNYVVLSMRVMTRVSHDIWDVLGDAEFVRCIHSMGSPRPNQRKTINHWPCNPEKVFIGHFPDKKEITSFGSGYGGNSLLGKKCFALRIASNLARDEGWLAEHMLIMGITEDKTGRETFIAAAFPSACGKTNMAMLTPSIPGFTVRCVGDDIAWMRFDEKGDLYGINPEAGFFGVCPGTNMKTNPNAMLTCMKNSIFTNIAETSSGGFFWEGLEDEVDRNESITTWLNQPWKIGMPGKAAHPNSRFCCPASQCPIIHPKWEDPKGVPISAFIFGGRRPTGVPLVFEAFSWEHGVMIGACVKSEATAAAEFSGKQIMHDPMAMRPFMGYNFGKYLEHWLSLNKKPHKMPKIFHVNWFRTDEHGQFLWPGFGENIRVLEWIIKRVYNEGDIALRSPIGYLPKKGKVVMHDPFAMRPFFGYNFGHYLDHWLSFQDNKNCKLPKIFHVNWFRKGPNGFLWPGFGENSRVLDWIFRRLKGEDCATKSAIGYIPKKGSINLTGLKEEVDMDALFHLPKDFWQMEAKELSQYFEEQVGEDLPGKIRQELKKLEQRVNTEL